MPIARLTPARAALAGTRLELLFDICRSHLDSKALQFGPQSMHQLGPSRCNWGSFWQWIGVIVLVAENESPSLGEVLVLTQ